MKHLWTIDGKKFNFCVKCGKFKDETQANECSMPTRALKHKYPHSLDTGFTCRKCGAHRFKIYYYPTKCNRLEYIGIKATVANNNYPCIEIHCTMNTTEWMIKDVIE